jgi:hypothetical protein
MKLGLTLGTGVDILIGRFIPSAAALISIGSSDTLTSGGESSNTNPRLGARRLRSTSGGKTSNGSGSSFTSVAFFVGAFFFGEAFFLVEGLIVALGAGVFFFGDAFFVVFFAGAFLGMIYYPVEKREINYRDRPNN